MMQDLQIIYEDNHYIAVNKLAGVLVQGDSTGDRTLADDVKQYIKIRYDKPGDVFLGVIHRLDRPVSGVVIFARTSKGLSRMNELFRQRQVKKTYWAIVDKYPDPLEGTLTHFLKKDHERNVTKSFDFMSRRAEGAKKATLDYKLIGHTGQHSLLEVCPHTGRPHQIRAQLAKAGYPILGDVKYGSSRAGRHGGIYLHSRGLEFLHPVRKEPVKITAELPQGDQFWDLFVELQADFE